MNIEFPISHGISQDAASILEAIDRRSREIKKISDSLGIIYQIGVMILNKVAVVLGLVAVAGCAVSIAMINLIPLKIAALSAVLAISCAALGALIHPHSSGESFIRNNWQLLCRALRDGDGEGIIKSCQELAEQKNVRKNNFNDCLGNYDSQKVTVFFYKAMLIGYFLLAVQAINDQRDEDSSANAKQALHFFDSSGFPEEVKKCLKNLETAPEDIRNLLKLSNTKNRLYALDFLSTAVSA